MKQILLLSLLLVLLLLSSLDRCHAEDKIDEMVEHLEEFIEFSSLGFVVPMVQTVLDVFRDTVDLFRGNITFYEFLINLPYLGTQIRDSIDDVRIYASRKLDMFLYIVSSVIVISTLGLETFFKPAYFELSYFYHLGELFEALKSRILFGTL